MKVKHLKRILNHMGDNTDICVLWYEQETVTDDTGHELTDSEWRELCVAFDEADGDEVFDDKIVEWLQLMAGTIINNRER